MKYSDIIGVNENFQYSVNLQFDINNISKIKEYIPTKDGCELLKKYIFSVLKGKNRATTLIGPYGKGKSHLLLVLITLLDDYENDDEALINVFLDKVKKVDDELYDMLIEVRRCKKKLMPVIINSNYGDLNQAFLLALSEALEREKLSSIVVNTYFDVALKVIEKWEDNYREAINEFQRCLKQYDYDIKELKNGLKSYSEKHYNVFKNVYSCILHGQEFNPLVNSDIVKTYKDMAHEIKKYGFDGIFIVFDEFSKFLEYVENAHIMKDLKLLQDFAELANRTADDEQIHLSCISHKAMNQYAKNLDEDKINAFKTVEGRFKELFFNRSIEQNFEIVSYALEKKEDFKKSFKDYYLKNIENYSEIKKLNIFSEQEEIEHILFEGCFPLNPLTVYSLIGLSEKIAQNERTLFTFLTDDDLNSLKSFIKNNGEGLFNINKVYDYFKPLLKKEMDEHIKDIWLKAENALSKVKDENEKDVIKALAVIYMINEIEIFVPDDVTIRLALGVDGNIFEKTINSLIEKSIIKRRKITEELEFTTVYNRELSKEIKRLNETQFYDINLRETLNEVIGKFYSLPRRYNEEYKITRFFDNIFISEKELMQLNSFEPLFENNYCDGIIIKLIRESRNIQAVREVIEKINSNKIVLEVPKTIFPKTIISLLRDYKSINHLIKDKDISGEASSELELIQKETIDTINEQLTIYFSKDNIQEYIYQNEINKKIGNISGYLSDICMKIYCDTPIINNELINKKDLSAPIKRAREIVLDAILYNDISLIKSKTSAEATIYKAIVEKKHTKTIQNVLDIINNFIKRSENKKISFKDIYSTLEIEPYSIRKGIIPILIAMALYNYSDIIVIYFMNKEIDLDSNNLIKINEAPEKYYLYTEKGTAEKIKYLSNLMNLYNIPDLDTQRMNLKKLVDTMRRWVLSLPRILREYSISTNELSIKGEYIIIKDELLRPDINNNEFIYSRLLEIFSTKSYELIVIEMQNMKKTFDNFIDTYFEILVNKTKEVFNKNFKGSINLLLKEWFDENMIKSSKKIYDLKTKNFIEYIDSLTTHDEKEIAEKIAQITTGYYVEDWHPDDYKIYIDSLNNIIKDVKEDKLESKLISNKILLTDGEKTIEKYINSTDSISAIGNTMKNNIEEIINEYGDSLSEQEKITVLIDIIKKYM